MNFGYTYKLSWKEYDPFFQVFVEKSFRTTEDAIDKHVENLNRRKWDSAGNEMIISVKVEKL